MAPYLQSLVALTATLLPLTSAASSCRSTAPSSLPVHEIFLFPQGTYVEALAFRSNGQLLVTLLAPEAAIYQIDTAQKCAKRVVGIPSLNGLYGMTETLPDQFYVAGGNFSLLESTRDTSSFEIWHINMTTFESTGAPTIERVSTFANATPNGLYTLNAEEGSVLVADSTNGVVYRVNVLTGENEITVSDDLIKPPANASTYPSPNGLDVVDGVLYFTNTGAGIVGTVPISEDGVQTGPAETFVVTNDGASGGDDFTIDEQGNLILAGNPNNWLGLIRDGSNEVEIIAGGVNSTDLLGPNTVRCGTSCEDVDRGSVYIGTSGGLAQYRSGNFTMGGGVYRVDLGPLDL